MPFSRRTSRYSAFPSQVNITSSLRNSRNNYKPEQTGIRRHEVISKITGLDSIALGDYAFINLLQFKRSFGAGADDPPTPTASNNYASTQIMNGSKAYGYQANIKLSNVGSGNTVYIDVYTVTTSFADAIYMNDTYEAESPVQYRDSSATVDLQGQVLFKTVHVIWTENTYKNFKGLQRHIRLLGTLALTSEDGGSPNAEFVIQGLPAKCRRSQTGMFYGLMFHYSSTKNTDANKYLGYFYFGDR